MGEMVMPVKTPKIFQLFLASRQKRNGFWLKGKGNRVDCLHVYL
jgi:hypothetical protein